MKDTDESRTRTRMSFGKGDKTIHFSISEYNSAEDASKSFYSPRSHGTSVKFNTYGDEGEKIFSQSGDFWLLNFRKGNVFVTIGGTDEKTAERFAGYVVEAISNLTHK